MRGTAITKNGALAQLGEHLLCKQGVIGSIPIGSTSLCCCAASDGRMAIARMCDTQNFPGMKITSFALLYAARMWGVRPLFDIVNGF